MACECGHHIIQHTPRSHACKVCRCIEYESTDPEADERESERPHPSEVDDDPTDDKPGMHRSK